MRIGVHNCVCVWMYKIESKYLTINCVVVVLLICARGETYYRDCGACHVKDDSHYLLRCCLLDRRRSLVFCWLTRTAVSEGTVEMKSRARKHNSGLHSGSKYEVTARESRRNEKGIHCI